MPSLKTEQRRKKQWAVGIVVPAHNEEALIVRCLESLVCVRHDGPLWIVVVADECTDRTANLARSTLQGRGEVVESSYQNAGLARAFGADRVIQHFGGVEPNRLWIANTDADSWVPPTWLERQLDIANAGAHAIAGVVDVDSFDDFSHLGNQMNSQFVLSYGEGQDGPHGHVQAANLGVSADAYSAVGGWPPIGLGEDRELWNRIGAQGFHRVADRSVRVTTSGRSKGRIRGGFAHSLNLLAARCATVTP
jgi:glycosyltransferase involved in cell wall biosynthesis